MRRRWGHQIRHTRTLLAIVLALGMAAVSAATRDDAREASDVSHHSDAHRLAHNRGGHHARQLSTSEITGEEDEVLAVDAQ